MTLFHAGMHYQVSIPIGEGRIALFFIVSGFVFAWITFGREPSPGRFLLRRVIRLIPLYWLVTALTRIASAYGLGSHAPPTLEHLAASFAFWPHLDASGRLLPVLMPGWTLNYEMLFCLVFAASLYLPTRLRLLGLTLGLGAAGLAGPLLRPADPVIGFFANSILLEFLAGLWLAQLWRWWRPRVSRSGALAALAAGVVLSFANPLLYIARSPLLFSALPAFLTVFGAIGLEQIGDRPIAWLKRVGDSSYSIYLWHVPALVAAARLCDLLRITDVRVEIGLCTIAGIAAGLVLYPVLEAPLTKWLNARADGWSRGRAAASPTPRPA